MATEARETSDPVQERKAENEQTVQPVQKRKEQTVQPVQEQKAEKEAPVQPALKADTPLKAEEQTMDDFIDEILGKDDIVETTNTVNTANEIISQEMKSSAKKYYHTEMKITLFHDSKAEKSQETIRSWVELSEKTADLIKEKLPLGEKISSSSNRLFFELILSKLWDLTEYFHNMIVLIMTFK
jgi:hypothetical protein